LLNKKNKKTKTKRWYETAEGTPDWDSRLLAGAAYSASGSISLALAPIPAILGMFASKNQFVFRHAKQAFALQLATLVILAINGIFDFGIKEMFGVEYYEEHSKMYVCIEKLATFLVATVPSIGGMIQSLRGKPFVVPVYGKLWQTTRERREQKKTKEKGKYL
jgi:uncharacterized membrane protein